uniref:Uncharacterized protein n=1 Tax=Chaetoceros debilis TaxID=122233 RepID=A0A7S3QIY4_9STRA|mmetsp:Transcript_18713/g.28412  ORF Transcript_18713/g.28412 Transcript_18713/m.28412 type:complete len:220 (+) Transcript_18713:33-692(+)
MKKAIAAILASLFCRRMLISSFCLYCPTFQKKFSQGTEDQRGIKTTNNNIFAATVQQVDTLNTHITARNDDLYEEMRRSNNGVDNNNEYVGGNLSGERRQEKEEEVEEPYFDSLDIVLERARKRQMVMLPIQIQAIAGKTVIKLGLGNSSSATSYLTVGDCVLILVAVKLGSVGFSIGYVIGKASSPILRSSGTTPIMIVELWAGGLAVVFDIFWNNVF